MRRRRLKPHDLVLGHGLLDRSVAGAHDHAEAEAEGQQVAQGDGAVGRDGVVQRPVEALEHLAVGQLRQQAIDRLVEPQPALLHQDHGRRGGDRLGHGGDAEDRIPLQLVAALAILQAGYVDHGLPMPVDQGDGAGDLARFDRPPGRVMQALEAHAGEAALG